MTTMQFFHNRLFQSPEVFDPHLQGLAQLARANLADLSALKSDLEWVVWGEAGN